VGISVVALLHNQSGHGILSAVHLRLVTNSSITDVEACQATPNATRQCGGGGAVWWWWGGPSAAGAQPIGNVHC